MFGVKRTRAASSTGLNARLPSAAHIGWPTFHLEAMFVRRLRLSNHGLHLWRSAHKKHWSN